MGDPKVAEVARLRYLALTLTDDDGSAPALSHLISAWHSSVSAAVAEGQANGRIRADADIGLGLDAVPRTRPRSPAIVGAVDGEGEPECFPRHVDAVVDLLSTDPGRAA